MTSQPDELAPPSEPDRRGAARHAEVALRSIGQPNSVAGEFDFWDDRYEGRRLFSELLGTFFLVLVAVGGGMVSARFGGNAVPYGAKVVAPALMVMAIILFMGTVSGAHLNPAVSVAFAARGDFPWRRVPAYIVAQFLGAILATLLLWALIGKQGSAGLTLPGSGISTTTAMLWELVLTAGLVSVILGTASGAQQIGPLAAIGVGGYIALAGLWGSPVSGASMNPARSLGPALVKGDWTAWWAYLVGPVAGAAVAVGFAYILRGRGGGRAGLTRHKARSAPTGALVPGHGPEPRRPGILHEQRKGVAMTVTSEGAARGRTAARTSGKGPARARAAERLSSRGPGGAGGRMPGTWPRWSRMRSSRRIGRGIRSGCCWSRPRPGCRSWCRSGTGGCWSRRSRSTGARRCRWRPTWPPRPTSGLRVQLCGDAHLSNFGAFASPSRRLVFDVNDFDETLPGPFEWDVKRLAASLAVAGPGQRVQPEGPPPDRAGGGRGLPDGDARVRAASTSWRCGTRTWTSRTPSPSSGRS